MKISSLTIGLVACLVSATSAYFPKHLLPPRKFLAQSQKPKHGFFEQLIDHANPDLGTFQQYYVWSDKYYAGPGSPIVLTTPGESALDVGYDYLATGESIYGAFAKAIGGAVIILEHRYWGKSVPYKVLGTKNLQHLTLKNAIADFTHFARTAKLPFDPKGTSKATKAPWVFGGGSYPGSLAAWTEATANGTFWAYHASSAPVQAIYDFWQYLYPEERHLPNDCHMDITRVVHHVDTVLTHGSAKEIFALKKKFGLQDLKHAGDFAAALSIPVFYWQGSPTYVLDFCKWLKAGGNPKKHNNANGKSLDRALGGYSAYFKSQLLPYLCGNGPHKNKTNHNYPTGCLNSYNARSKQYTDTSPSPFAGRQWMWMLCNEPFGWWQTGGRRTDVSPIVSKFLNVEYDQRECGLYFPEEDGYTYGSNNGKTEDQLNAITQGWNTRPSTRLMYVNGEIDPWREAGVSSDFRPGGRMKSTPEVPIFVWPDGDHCPDFDPHVKGHRKELIDAEVATIKKWVRQHPRYRNKYV